MIRPIRIIGARLGQAEAEWLGRAKAALVQYDALLERLAMVADDDFRGEILIWIGRSDIPGSPAERYVSVKEDVTRGTYADELARSRVEQLETLIEELEAMVTATEESRGTISAPTRAEAVPGRPATASLIAGGIALLGLVVIPLLVD